MRVGSISMPPPSKKFGVVDSLSTRSLSTPYQLDQVLELIRLWVEVVDQEGLELLCGVVGSGGERRAGERGGERGVRTRDEESILKSLPSKSSSLRNFLSRRTSLQRVLVEGRHGSSVRSVALERGEPASENEKEAKRVNKRRKK